MILVPKEGGFIDRIQADIDYMTNKYNDDLILSYGPAHIVYDDYNTDDNSIFFCVELTLRILRNPTKENRASPSWIVDWNQETFINIMHDTLLLLVKLLFIPEENRGVYHD